MDANENGQGQGLDTIHLTEKDVSDRSNPSGKSSRERFPDFSKLERVQDLLERNKRMFHQVKQNHDSQRPEVLAKNFSLLAEINKNIQSVQNLYIQIEQDYITFMKSQVAKTNS